MRNETDTQRRLTAARLVVTRMLGIGPGHAGEALAHALGFNTHAALGASLRQGHDLAGAPDAARFRSRLADLGHDVAPDAADAALCIASGVVPDNTPADTRLARLLRIHRCILSTRARLASEHPDLRDILPRLGPVPDAAVATLSVGKDTLRWNPHFVESLEIGELEFVLAASALHRAAAHPLRRGGRDPVRWGAACDYAVHHRLVETRIGSLPMGGLYDERHGSDLTAEEIYDRLSAAEPPWRPMMSLYELDPWKARAPSRPKAVRDLAKGLAPRREHCGFTLETLAQMRFDHRHLTVRQAVEARGRQSSPEAGAVTDEQARSLGRLLARSIARLTHAQREEAVAMALGEVLDAYAGEMAAEVCAGPLGSDPAGRVGGA